MRAHPMSTFPRRAAMAAVLAVWAVSAQPQTAVPTQAPAPQAQTGAPVNETTDRWFVELASPPAVEGTALGVLRQEKDAFRRAARQAGLRFSEQYTFDKLWNGLSIRIDPSQIGALTRISGVAAVYPVQNITIPPGQAPNDPELITALAMTGADIVQNSLGFTGAGVKVGIIDTGIDYNHPDLGGGGINDSTAYPTARVIAGYDFVGDAFNGSNTPVPDVYPDDCNGHGTHVAGIVGANGAVKGVAPGVSFGAYRVFGCEGSTWSDIMIAAMERALDDGMQVVNMSIGSAFQWPQYPSAMAATRLVNKGVVVVASIGNEGTYGLYAASAPGVGSKVIGVASFNNTYQNYAAFSISPDGRLVAYSSASGAPPAPVSGTAAMARTGTTTTTNDACSALAPGSLAGKIALIRRGTCSFYQKARNAQLAGAAGVAIYNNAPGIQNITVAGTPAVAIPVVSISAADGGLINDRIAAGEATLTWTASMVSIPNSTGGLISSFSSYGMAPDLSLKPDIGAPGGLIRSTVPIEQGSYATFSGTSMSSPHVAGAAALLLQARPHTPAQAVGGILQNSALPKAWSGNPALGFLDTVHRQGAGMLQIDKSILATTVIEPAKLALGESEAGPATRTLSITNQSGSPVTYNLSHTAALATGPDTFVPAFFNAPAAVAFSSGGVPVTQVTAPSFGTVTVNVTITAPAALADRSLYGGYLVFTPNAGEQVYRVPYAGFKGDYQSIPVLVPTPAGFPWLARAVGTSYVKQSAGASFTMADGDIPYVVMHLDHEVRLVRMEVFDANTGRAWHRALEADYVSRNSLRTSFFAVPWDGMTANGRQTDTVPNGQYVIRLSILKALGDASNPAHWETWTTPMFAIARP